MERAFRVICTHKAGQAVKPQFLKLLLKNLPRAQHENEGETMLRCEEFFNLTATLVKACQEHFTTVKDSRQRKGSFQSSVLAQVNVVDLDRLILENELFNADYLLDVLVTQLSLRPLLESKSGQVCDKVLAGYL